MNTDIFKAELLKRATEMRAFFINDGDNEASTKAVSSALDAASAELSMQKYTAMIDSCGGTKALSESVLKSLSEKPKIIAVSDQKETLHFGDAMMAIAWLANVPTYEDEGKIKIDWEVFEYPARGGKVASYTDSTLSDETEVILLHGVGADGGVVNA